MPWCKITPFPSAHWIFERGKLLIWQDNCRDEFTVVFIIGGKVKVWCVVSEREVAVLKEK